MSKLFEEYKTSTELHNESEESKARKARIEYWKTYRGAITKIKLTNNETEQFLKDYRSNFKGEKTDEDEKLITILNGENGVV